MLKQLALAAVMALAAMPALAESDIEVEINGGIAPLKGSLLLPEGEARVPAVLIIPGSGPTDRNCNGPGGFHTDAYKLVAVELAKHGVASLRFDKRGVAASTNALTKEENLRFDTYVDDAVAWVAFLKQHKRVSRVVILGHSEGALVGSIAAQRPGVDAFISLAGAGFRAGETLRRQLGPQLPAELKARAFVVIAELEAGRTVTNAPVELAALFRPSVQPYLISWFKYDPAAEVAKLRMPALIVQGTTDIQVKVDDAKALAAAAPGAKLVLIDGMNHILRAAPLDRAANAATYSQPTLPLKPELMPALAGFVGR